MWGEILTATLGCVSCKIHSVHATLKQQHQNHATTTCKKILLRPCGGTLPPRSPVIGPKLVATALARHCLQVATYRSHVKHHINQVMGENRCPSPELFCDVLSRPSPLPVWVDPMREEVRTYFTFMHREHVKGDTHLVDAGEGPWMVPDLLSGWQEGNRSAGRP